MFHIDERHLAQFSSAWNIRFIGTEEKQPDMRLSCDVDSRRFNLRKSNETLIFGGTEQRHFLST
ncbi:MAG TPA: hypothetical protein VKR81_01790, partial [Candidatus Binatia bacterium]|nr:hypothetical protein [Candidatus Binatia bacterium]